MIQDPTLNHAHLLITPFNDLKNNRITATNNLGDRIVIQLPADPDVLLLDALKFHRGERLSPTSFTERN